MIPNTARSPPATGSSPSTSRSEKFLFFDIVGLAPKLRAVPGKTVEILIYVNRREDELELSIGRESSPWAARR